MCRILSSLYQLSNTTTLGNRKLNSQYNRLNMLVKILVNYNVVFVQLG
jgi:hypothetical protein